MRHPTRFLSLKACVVTLCWLFSAVVLDAQKTGVGWWRFDESQGQVASDSSGAGNNGRLGSTPGVDPNDPFWISPGRLGPAALNFVTNQFAAVPDSPSLRPSTITIQAWVRANSSPGQFKYIVSKGASGCLAASYALYTGSEGGAAFYIFNGTDFILSPFAPDASVWNGAWHHLLGTYDGITVRLFLDGSEVGTGTSAGGAKIQYNLSDNNDVSIGSYGSANCPLPFTGDIDEVRIWNQPLTRDTVSTLATKACNFVTVGVTPATVPIGGKVTVTAEVQNCSTGIQPLVITFDVTTPCTRSVVVSIPVILPRGFAQAVSFPLVIPRGTCTGAYTVSATSLVKGFPIVMSSADLSVTP
jgi:hypothetical protein